MKIGAGDAMARQVEHVLLDGEDVINDCVFADDENGCVRILKRNADGQCFKDDENELASEVRYGKVEIKMRSSAVT